MQTARSGHCEGLFFVFIREGSSWLHHISLSNHSLTKCFEEVRQYRPKLGFGKEARQNDSVVYCEVLGRALHAAVFPPPTLAAYNSLRSLLFFSFFSFFFFHGGLAGWVRKTNWRKSPLSSGRLWHDLWWQPQEETVSWNPSFIESVLLRGKTALWAGFMANAGNGFACILKERHFWPQLMNHTYLLWHMPTICS